MFALAFYIHLSSLMFSFKASLWLCVRAPWRASSCRTRVLRWLSTVICRTTTDQNKWYWSNSTHSWTQFIFCTFYSISQFSWITIRPNAGVPIVVGLVFGFVQIFDFFLLCSFLYVFSLHYNKISFAAYVGHGRAKLCCWISYQGRFFPWLILACQSQRPQVFASRVRVVFFLSTLIAYWPTSNNHYYRWKQACACPMIA